MISIIVPVYNKENYLKRCIESILQQDYSDFELILVDDGSTDNSSDICKRYSNVDSRIHYFSQKNGGVSSARNFGLANSHGDYIAFVDPDDYIHPELMSSLMNCLKEEDADISYCFAMDFHENSSNMSTQSHESGDKIVIKSDRFDWGGASIQLYGALLLEKRLLKM